MDYIIQENAWSSSNSTSKRMKQAKVFLGDASKSIYIVTEFHTSDELLQGSEIFTCITRALQSTYHARA